MPPRFAYWTIIVDNQPTSFRSSSIEELMPTFNGLKLKNPSAVMMWFQNGRLWVNRLDAQEAQRLRAEQGRRNDPRQRSMEGEGSSPRRDVRGPDGKLEWKPKGTFVPAPKSRRIGEGAKADEKRDPKRWRPGGEHKDPRQKYKDGRKAKWTRFKEKVRSRSSRSAGPPKKRDR